MCGIVACRTAQPAAGYLLSALKLLEYRGYDSVGVAVRDDTGAVTTVRTVSRVDELRRRIDGALPGGTGIGHTRWATHGGVSERNAHPHRDCAGRVSVVHNGIIENAEAVRLELLMRGHRFASEGDSEVIAHLVEDELAQGRPLRTAVGDALAALEGTWAIVVLDAESGQLVAAANGSPLLVGSSGLGTFFASDAGAIADWVEEFRILRDGDLVELADSLEWLRAGVPTAAPAAVAAAPARRAATPLKADDFMAQEIAEQPEVVARIVGELLEPALDGSLWRGLGAPAMARLAVLGCGTSLHAGMAVAGVFGSVGRVPNRAIVASEAADAVLEPGTLLLAFSQSGETADVLRALDVLEPDSRLVSVTNVAHSTLARRSLAIVPCQAGSEVGVAATKTFTAQIVAGSCLALSALVARGTIGVDQAASVGARLRGLPERLARAIELSAPRIDELADSLVTAPGFVFLGRGRGVVYAMEGALKLKELSYRWAEAHPAGELKHGPLALVEEGTPVIAIDTGVQRLEGNLAEVAARGARVIRIGGPDSTLPVLEHGADDPWGPIEAAVPLQLLARRLAELLGRDVDKPRNLAKAVTVD